MIPQAPDHHAAIARHECHVRAFVDFDEQAARRRQAEHGRNAPLAGWAIAVKDIIDVAGLPTRCNSTLTSPAPAAQDAAIVARLKRLGAYVIGKTVTATFAYFDPGETRNPWNLQHTPGGSSSGSAAAVAAGFARLALGTQTGGSINRPASFCGCVGFKPSFATLPTEGVYPLAPSLDTVGIFTANVRDAHTAMAALLNAPLPRSDNPAPARPLRFAVMEGLRCDPPDEEMIDAVRCAAAILSEAGHHVRTLDAPASLAQAHEDHGDLMCAQAAQSHQQLFESRESDYSPKLTELIRKGRNVPPARLAEIALRRREVTAELTRFIDGFDFLLTPSAPGAALKGLAITGDHRMNRIWTYTGFPSLTIPALLTQTGLPLGVQLVAPRGCDLPLLALGETVEAAIGFRDRPGFPGADESLTARQ